MSDARQTLDQYFLEMRWRCLSLAADLDRIERADGGKKLIASDPRLAQLRNALRIVQDSKANRAEQVQMIFSEER